MFKQWLGKRHENGWGPGLIKRIKADRVETSSRQLSKSDDPVTLATDPDSKAVQDGFDALMALPDWGQQAWLWEEADDRKVRHVTSSAYPELSTEMQASLKQRIQTWSERPLQWRIQGSRVQVVWIGGVRWTWDQASDTLSQEMLDPWRGWSPATDSFVDRACLSRPNTTRRNGALNCQSFWLLNAMGREAQRSTPGRVWMNQSSVPQWMPWKIDGEFWVDHQSPALWSAWRKLSRALVQMDPKWKILRRSMTAIRRNPELENEDIALAIWSNIIQTLKVLSQSSAWWRVLAENPRADLWWSALVQHEVAPSLHTWRHDAWCARYRGWSSSTMNWLAQAPQAWVREALSQDLEDRKTRKETWGDRALVLAWLQPGHMPLLAGRKVPSVLWQAAAKRIAQGGPRKDIDNDWTLRVLSAFFKVCRREPWVEDRTTLQNWMQSAEDVLAWASTHDQAPWTDKDPSWGWTRLTRQYWMVRQESDWLSPLLTGSVEGWCVQSITSYKECRWVGETMHNCLKDSRSAGLLERVKEGKAFIVRLVDPTGSTSLASWAWNSAYQKWTLRQHVKSGNQTPQISHEIMVDRLKHWIDHRLTPGWGGWNAPATLVEPAFDVLLNPKWSKRRYGKVKRLIYFGGKVTQVVAEGLMVVVSGASLIACLVELAKVFYSVALNLINWIR